MKQSVCYFFCISYFSNLTDYLNHVRLSTMKATSRPDAVWFTTKGQIVIPARLRRQFNIEEGTKALVEATPDGILLKPITAVTIRRLRGILKRKPGEKPFAEQWAEHKRQEMELEQANASSDKTSH
jgi:AbrB family looped-hinge helix DNA binding protein